MTLKDFLDDNPIINKTQFANEMWPDNKSAKTKLSNKLAENIVGSGKQRITDNDTYLVIEVLDNLIKNIEKFKNSNIKM